MASVGQLAAGVAHEINNPMGFISNNMEILEQYIADYAKVLKMMDQLKGSVAGGNLEEAKSIVEEINKLKEEINLDYVISDTTKLLQHNRDGIKRIQKIVMDMRAFAREDKNVMEHVKIEDVIEGVLNIVHSEIKYKAKLEKNYGDTPLIECNPQRLGQVFINMIINALHAIDGTGTIAIKTYRQDESVCVDVHDTGKGIPPENLNKIFDPFFTTKPIGQGTGLGLSVSHEIIKKHNGSMTVRSKVGEGTTFTVMLPINQKEGEKS
jgi:signal transduction histidine kinase